MLDLMVEQHVRIALEVVNRAYVLSRGRVVRDVPAAITACLLDELRDNFPGAVVAHPDPA